jgi:hypothetical protein
VRPPQPRFKIRWLMEATAIPGIALWSLRFSKETWSSILGLLVLYRYGLDPLRQLYGFSPVRRYLARFVKGHMELESDGQLPRDCEMWKA